MALTPGTRLGPYEVTAAIGAGGMGEVYRAHDTKLGRDVALKILPEVFAQDADRLARFQREAHVLASLNHPHIAAIYGLEETDGVTALVMELVEGPTLADLIARANGKPEGESGRSSLRDGASAARRGGGAPRGLRIDDALSIAKQIAEALEAAHEHNIIHRDLKPANVKVRDDGTVKVLDFGLAKELHPVVLSGDIANSPTVASPTITSPTMTEQGVILGTVAYMSPEQAEGRNVDARSDVFSLGVVLYQMLCGVHPFSGGATTLATLASILRSAPAPLRLIRRAIPADVERIVMRCLEKAPDARYASAKEVRSALTRYQTGRGGLVVGRPVVVAAASVVLIGAGVLGGWMYQRASHVRWAEQQALPEIVRLMEEVRPLAALTVLREAEQYIPSSLELNQLREDLLVSSVTIETTPSGADVYAMDYGAAADEPWHLLGRTPVETDWLARGYYRLRVVKDGFVPVEQAVGIGGAGSQLAIPLHAVEEVPGGMVWVPGIPAGFSGTRVFSGEALTDAVPGFWLDRNEVTNRDFQQFVDVGAYERPELWTHDFVREGRSVSLDEVRAAFHDRTGRLGPATWELGTYPDGGADLPVGGVSWYEAAAYCESVGKELPTVYHWYRAAGSSPDILRFSNFSGRGVVPVEQHRGLGPFGTYDMAGNVKEWVLNPSGDLRFILGGGWTDPDYLFIRPDAQHPLERNVTFGFRCARYDSPVPLVLTGSVPLVNRDRRGDQAVDDRAFRIYENLHRYDKSALEPSVDSVEDDGPHWRLEHVSFNAAYGDERVIAHVYLPRSTSPPYSVVVYMGGYGTLTQRTVPEAAESLRFGFVLRSGRALVVPAYKGTLERGPGAYHHQLGQPNLWREMNLQWSMDLGRTIDYLETRPDIDTTRLAFYGYSMGAAMGPRLVAVERRIKAAVFFLGGSFEKVSPEVDSWNFAPRVKVPVLMLNGRSDFSFPLESSQIPLFEHLGTPAADKKHVVFEGGHSVGDAATRSDFIREFLDWLDRYLGPLATG